MTALDRGLAGGKSSAMDWERYSQTVAEQTEDDDTPSEEEMYSLMSGFGG